MTDIHRFRRFRRFERIVACLRGSVPFRYNRGMNITLNGQPFEVPDGTTVAGLVSMRQKSGHLKTNAYAVELNRDVCLRPEHATTKLKPNDKVEVVVMVGGG